MRQARHFDWAVNSERDARIKKSILIRSLNKSKPRPNKTDYALEMQNEMERKNQMKPVLVVKKVKQQSLRKSQTKECQTGNNMSSS